MVKRFAILQLVAALYFSAHGSTSLAATSTLTPLVVYSPHGSEILSMAAARFQKKYPEIRIDWRYYGAEEIFKSLLMEKDQALADIWWGGPQFVFMAAKHHKLLAPLTPQNLAQVETGGSDPDGYWLGDMQTPVTIFYQKEISTIPPPSDWNDLILDRYKGHIALRSADTSGTMRAFLAAMIDHRLRQGMNLASAFEWFKRLDTQVGSYYSHSQMLFQSVGKGLEPFSVWNISEITMRMEQGFPLDFVYPKSGMPVIVDGLALIKKPKQHPYANRFVDFLLTKEMASTLAKPPYSRIHRLKGLDGKLKPAYLSNLKFKEMKVDWLRVAMEGDAWLAQWEKTFNHKKLKTK